MSAGKFKSMLGLKSGELTVIKEFDNGDRTRCICQCSCGSVVSMGRHGVRHGKSKSCGCKKRINQKRREKTIKNMLGTRFGRLVVEKVDEEMSNLKDELCFVCSCDCGNEISVEGRKLRKGVNRSCGCLKSEKSSERLKDKWKDEDYRKMKKRTHQEYWRDDEKRSRHIEKTRVATLKQWQDDDYRRKQILAHGGDPNNGHFDKSRSYKSPGYDKWKTDIFKRENYTCEKCGRRGVYLCAHHKDGYHWCKEGRTDLSNGACLCRECHDKFHRKYGKRYNTEDQYIAFLIEDLRDEEDGEDS